MLIAASMIFASKGEDMQAISEIMTPDVAVISPNDNVLQAARLMRDRNVGAIPVCDGKRLVGMITDRDITTRVVAEGLSSADAKIADIMTDQVLWCFEDQTPGEVLQQMGDQQIRRIPVINRNMELIGVVSLGDLATRTREHTDSALEDISSSMPPERPGTGAQPSQH
jgi:CBS domain-containing protein